MSTPVDKETSLSLLKKNGVVGAGGAGFPTYFKYRTSAEIVIANGVECEPLLEADQWLMKLEPARIIAGIREGMRLAGARRGVLAVKKKYREQIEALRPHLGEDIELFLMDSYYPAGDEHVLVHEITGKIVPELGIPLATGAIVNNVATFANISRALEGQPVISRLVTVTGAVERPFTAEVAIGTSIMELARLARPRKGADAIILGGPMMGALAASNDVPVTKTLGGVIYLEREHYLVRLKSLTPEEQRKKGKIACCNCSYCTSVCPRYLLGHRLEPHRLMKAVSFGNQDPALLTSAELCVECGACIYACVMELSPKDINAWLKKELRRLGLRLTPLSNLKANEFREGRKIPTDRLISRLRLDEYYHIKTPYIGPVETKRVTIPLKQHTGRPAVPLVSPGKKVTRGEVIGAIEESELGAFVHASIDGEVKEADSEKIVIEG